MSTRQDAYEAEMERRAKLPPHMQDNLLLLGVHKAVLAALRMGQTRGLNPQAIRNKVEEALAIFEEQARQSYQASLRKERAEREGKEQEGDTP